MEEFNVSELTKELVAAKLRQMDDPCAAAAALVKKTLSVALRGLRPGEQSPAGVVEAACGGAMKALLLAEQSLAKGAVLILEAVVEVNTELNLDQTSMIQGALRGMADIRRFSTPDQLECMRVAIEAQFMGAGEAFKALLQEPAR